MFDIFATLRAAAVVILFVALLADMLLRSSDVLHTDSVKFEKPV